MFGNPGRIVLTENKATNPRYSLSYLRGASDKNLKKFSYDIISRLVKDQDLLLEIKSALFSGFNLDANERIFEKILNQLREMKLDYRQRRNLCSKEIKLFGVSVSINQKVTEHELLIYIPNHTWVKDRFWESLPEYGVTYRVLNRKTDGLKLLDDIHTGQIFDSAIQEHCEITIFDCSSFGQMGIETDLAKEELENCLKA